MYNEIRNIIVWVIIMEEQNNNTSKNGSFEFEQISRFISERLNDPNNDFVHYKNRDVYIKTEAGEKKIVIPSKENMAEWQRAWVNVFEMCLYALQMKVNKSGGYINGFI